MSGNQFNILTSNTHYPLRYDYGARFYDPQIGRWHSPDLHSENYISWSPYHYGANNPIKVIELNGMDYYYTVGGRYLGQDDKKTAYVYAVNNDSWSGKNGNFVVLESGMTQIMDNKGNGMLHDQFKDLAGTLFAEADIKTTWKESAGIYSVLENRAKADDKTTLEEANSSQVSGWKRRDEINNPKADKNRVQSAYEGLIRGALDSKDYSGGGFYWQGEDFQGHRSYSSAHETYYLGGFEFTNPSHDIFNLGNHSSDTSPWWNYHYESTGTSGKTTFMKMTQKYQRANPSKY